MLAKYFLEREIPLLSITATVIALNAKNALPQTRLAAGSLQPHGRPL